MSQTNGKMQINAIELYELQKLFQGRLTGKQVPLDSLQDYSYHIQAMVEELGELVKADKRWKTLRNTYYDKEEKLDELADVYITVMNIAMYSDFSMEDLLSKVAEKIHINNERLDNELNNY